MAEMDDEGKWIQDSLAGDETAFATLVAKYQRMVHAVALLKSLLSGEVPSPARMLERYSRLACGRGLPTLARAIKAPTGGRD